MTTAPAPRNRNVQRLRPLVAGEKPDPFAPAFTDAYGTPLTDLDGWDAKAVLQPPTGEPIEQDAAVVENIPVMDTWPTLDLAGTWSIEMWIGNGTLRYCSDLYVFDVGDALAEVIPSV